MEEVDALRSAPWGAFGLDQTGSQPASTGGTAQSVYVAVSDLDAIYERVVASGAEVFNPLHDAGYGRGFCCFDPEGHIWTFGTYRPEG